MASLSFIPISAGTGTRLVFRPIYPQEAAVVVAATPEGVGRRGRRRTDRIEQNQRVLQMVIKAFMELQ